MEHWKHPWNSLRSPLTLKWGIFSILSFTLCTVAPILYPFISPILFPLPIVSFQNLVIFWAESWLKPHSDLLASVSLSVLGSWSWGSMQGGFWERRSDFNEVSLVLWKLTSLGWDLRQISIGFSLSNQVYLILPQERANETKFGNSSCICNTLTEITEKRHFIVNPFGKWILNIKCILGTDLCVWSVSVSVILVVKIWGIPELFLDWCHSQGLLHAMFPRTRSVG